MKKYFNPEMKIITFDFEDVVTESGLVGTPAIEVAKEVLGDEELVDILVMK